MNCRRMHPTIMAEPEISEQRHFGQPRGAQFRNPVPVLETRQEPPVFPQISRLLQ
ncbi:MAG: hypothetical protein RIT02_3446 [Planctomycetota bacterium]